ncbi:spermidine synthase [Megasphaera cerevisiae DSM 20462]|jgi:spermidine synthase|uniref:Polyamine aminopropyltransferase n=1 Tax=Megasphaera cerevisiae DSM 20462 TaxID=1122219 RepID=A0A0J6WXJ6_9FIRM|nr:polyamine aminopropyltransferase [Megasphaera cerevisiae]KMO86953.1 spermidine synthase [Megasphaera cerevisiae DSM 20462]OKY54093.1 spermidine synthase [Megasphaera cerevisiae]SJZ56264.1 spermidine synthase [Megasphaera cerevisiae DSM 20462]
MKEFVTEHQSPYLDLTTEVSDILYKGNSEYQDIIVAESREFGRMLVLDGVFQTSVKDEFIYHESIAHIPLFLHPSPKNVLIIGGGDGGAAREAVRHPEVEQVTMVDIDGKVIELSKRYFPSIAKAMLEGNPKLTVRVGDGIGFMKEAADFYDVIIVDCSDPVGPGEGLFTYDFYKSTYKALKKDGLFVQQTESPFMHQPLIQNIWASVSDIFPITRLYTSFIPLYPSGMHCFTMGSKQYDPLQWTPNRNRIFPTRYYNEGIQRSAFVLPNFVKDLLYGEKER